MDSNRNISGNSDLSVTYIGPNELQIAHLVFLVIVGVVGTIGNIMTIIAVRIERKLRESYTNMFVINLAVADLLVCASVVPLLVAHDARAETLFGPAHCYFAVIISGVACHTAAATMTCIAVTRYIAASNATNFHDIVTKKRVRLTVFGVWLFAAINTAPILAAWMTTPYDSTRYVCVCFDGAFPLYYTLGPVFIGHFVPHAVTIYCYFRLMRAIRGSRKRVTSSSAATNNTLASGDASQSQYPGKSTVVSTTEAGVEAKKNGLSVSTWSKHEIQLFKTSLWIIGFFSFCWIPYGVLVLLQNLAPVELKKTFASLCLLSFSLNPMIYGLLSKAFRRAYRRILRKVFCNNCGQPEKSYSYSSRGNSTGNSTAVSNSVVEMNMKTTLTQETYQADEKMQYGRAEPVEADKI